MGQRSVIDDEAKEALAVMDGLAEQYAVGDVLWFYDANTLDPWPAGLVEVIFSWCNSRGRYYHVMYLNDKQHESKFTAGHHELTRP